MSREEVACRWAPRIGGIALTRIVVLALVAALSGCQSGPASLDLVERVDLDRYLGRWYEIASIPQYFQRGCVATQALYSLREDGRIRVENECRVDSLDGEVRRAEGVAWVEPGDDSNARLRVGFFWPFWGRYWVIDLDPGYRWVVVGHPSREYLWILSRTPVLDESVYDAILDRLEAQGYDPALLVRTLQAPAS